MVIVERVLIVRVMDELSLEVLCAVRCWFVVQVLAVRPVGLGLVHCLYKYVSWAWFLFLFLIILH